jgi:hypothetical protein
VKKAVLLGPVVHKISTNGKQNDNGLKRHEEAGEKVKGDDVNVLNSILKLLKLVYAIELFLRKEELDFLLRQRIYLAFRNTIH